MEKEEMKNEVKKALEVKTELTQEDYQLLIQMINTYPIQGTLQNLGQQTNQLVQIRNKLMEMMK